MGTTRYSVDLTERAVQELARVREATTLETNVEVFRMGLALMRLYVEAMESGGFMFQSFPEGTPGEKVRLIELGIMPRGKLVASSG